MQNSAFKKIVTLFTKWSHLNIASWEESWYAQPPKEMAFALAYKGKCFEGNYSFPISRKRLSLLVEMCPFLIANK